MAKTVEVDETDFLANQNVVKTVNAMLGNPEAPNTAIPEIDAPAAVLDEVAKERDARLALQKRLDDKEAADELKARNDAFAAEWAGKKSSLAKQGYTDEGIVAIEKLAQERGIVDLEAAAALFDRLHPPAEPVSPNGFGGFDMFATSEEENKDMKALIDSRGEDESALRGLVNTALTDSRSGRR